LQHESQGHHTNQAYHKLDIISREYTIVELKAL